MRKKQRKIKREIIGGAEVYGAPYSNRKPPCYTTITSFVVLVFYPFVRIFLLALASSALISVIFRIAKPWCVYFVEIEDSFPMKRKSNIPHKSSHRLHIDTHIDIQRIRSNITFRGEILQLARNWFVNYLLCEWEHCIISMYILVFLRGTIRFSKFLRDLTNIYMCIYFLFIIFILCFRDANMI